MEDIYKHDEVHSNPPLSPLMSPPTKIQSGEKIQTDDHVLGVSQSSQSNSIIDIDGLENNSCISYLRLSSNGVDLSDIVGEFKFDKNDEKPTNPQDSNPHSISHSDSHSDSQDCELVDSVESSESSELTDRDYVVNFTDISHHTVLYHRNYSRSKGTLGQIVRSIEDMKERSQNPDPNNVYQTELYPGISKMCDTIVDRYSNLISGVSRSDYIVFGQYLNGMRNDGRMKETKIKHERKSYRYSQMKETLKSIKDRLRHITMNAKRCSKDITRSKENRETFRKVCNFCNQFGADVEGYIANWDQLVITCRNKCSIQDETNNSHNAKNKKRSKLVQIKSGPNSNIQKLVI